MKILLITILIAIISSCSDKEQKTDTPCDTELAKLLIEQNRLDDQRDSLWTEWRKLGKRIDEITGKED